MVTVNIGNYKGGNFQKVGKTTTQLFYLESELCEEHKNSTIEQIAKGLAKQAGIKNGYVDIGIKFKTYKVE